MNVPQLLNFVEITLCVHFLVRLKLGVDLNLRLGFKPHAWEGLES